MWRAVGAGVAAALLAASVGAAKARIVDVSARSFSIDETRCIWNWRGEARLRTRDGILRADRMQGYASRLEKDGRVACGALQRVEAVGRLVLETPRAELTGVEFAVYDVGTGSLALSGGSFSVEERD